MSKKLEGKIALVTGGSSGIGLATAKRFVAEGAHVYITGRRKAELEAAVREIGRNVTAVQADASKSADLDRLYAQIKQEKGKLDTIFANAGGGNFLPLGAITEEHYHETFDTNVKGVIFTVQKALPLLRDAGTIVLNASTAASQGMGAFSVYAASKAAVRNLARGWASDLKDRKIRVNAVSPGPTRTEGTDAMGGGIAYRTWPLGPVPPARGRGQLKDQSRTRSRPWAPLVSSQRTTLITSSSRSAVSRYTWPVSKSAKISAMVVALLSPKPRVEPWSSIPWGLGLRIPLPPTFAKDSA